MNSSDAPSHANPSSQNLDDLLERVKAATGPDRELDFLVNEATGSAWRVTLNEPGFVGEYVRGHNPQITASLDAALALMERVLPGWRIAEMKDGIRHEDGEYCQVRLWCPANRYLGFTAPANAATPALALLLTLLKALQQREAA